jgi:transposase
MEQNTLFPEVEGVRVDCLSSTIDTILMRMSAVAPYARCPSCSIPSERVHSHYTRTPADLPWAHCPVQLRLDVRKFFCDNPACKQRIFTERRNVSSFLRLLSVVFSLTTPGPFRRRPETVRAR